MGKKALLALTAASILLAGCTQPTVFRGEVDVFEEATAEALLYLRETITARSARIDAIRRTELTDQRPTLLLSPGCLQLQLALNEAAASQDPQPLDAESIAACRLELPDAPDLEPLFNPVANLNNAAAFSNAVSHYASQLDQVATAGSQEEFVDAIGGLGNAAVNVAKSAATASGKTAPTVGALGPIADVVGKATFYYLENKRGQALQEAAAAADPWIQQGAQAVVRILTSNQFEIANIEFNKLQEQVDAVNEAPPEGYVAAADQAVASHAAYRTLMANDAAAPFRRLPAAHKGLLSAFGDNKRGLKEFIAASKDVYNSARAARKALTGG